jgi:hypothetical protein
MKVRSMLASVLLGIVGVLALAEAAWAGGGIWSG